MVVLKKKKVLKRKPKYYNWAVKLYIPITIVGFLFVFGHIGFITGVYKILKNENEAIISDVFDNALKLYFESEESKNKLITELQQLAKETKDGSKVLIEFIKVETKEYNTGYSVIDRSKNKLASFILDKYGDDAYKICLYAMLNKAAGKAHINIDESLPYKNFSTGMDFLLEVGYKDIEKEIKNKLKVWLDSLLYSQYKSLILFQLILLFVIMSLPLIDFFINKKWIEPKYSN